MEELTIGDDSLTVEHRVSLAFRAALVAVGAAMLGVPWSLLVRPQWSADAGWPTAIVALIAAGTVALACVTLLAAFFALERRVRIDFHDDRVELAVRGAFGPWRVRLRRVRDIVAVRVELDEWTDGASDHRVVLVFRDGQRELLHRAPTEDQAERCAGTVRAWAHPPSI